MISIGCGSLSVGLAPHLGSGVAWFRRDQRDLLRPWREDLGLFGLSSFAMLPWTGRIRGGRFWRDNAEHRIPPTHADHPYPLHGHGWIAAWTELASGADFCRLGYRHDRPDWPWPYRAEQQYRLDQRGLALQISVKNLSGDIMPLGMGQHPYFPGGARIRTRLGRILPPMADLVADYDAPLPPDLTFESGHLAGTVALDHGFTGWDGSAELSWPDLTLRISADRQGRFVQIYDPPGEDFFCFEPMTCLANAVNWPAGPAESGLILLKPGDVARFECRIDLG